MMSMGNQVLHWKFHILPGNPLTPGQIRSLVTLKVEKGKRLEGNSKCWHHNGKWVTELTGNAKLACLHQELRWIWRPRGSIVCMAVWFSLAMLKHWCYFCRRGCVNSSRYVLGGIFATQSIKYQRSHSVGRKRMKLSGKVARNRVTC